MKPPIKMGAAILPLPPTKDKILRQRMRGVATIKSRALPEPSARPQVSTRPGGAQDPPLCVSQEQLEWIELEVARRVAAVLALSKDENAPTASAEASYKDAGTQIDAVIPTAKASGVGNDCVCIEKKVHSPSNPLSRFLTLFPTISTEFFISNDMLTISHLILILNFRKFRRLSQESLSKGPTKSCRQRRRRFRQDQSLK